MRPKVLFNLYKPLTTLLGVGPRIGAVISIATGGDKILDLLWHFPNGIIDRRYEPTVKDAQPGSIATIRVRVQRHYKPPNKRMPYRVICKDHTGEIVLIFFRAREDYLKRILPEDMECIISGKIEMFDGTLQMSHPDHVFPYHQSFMMKRIEPVYGLSAGLSLKILNKAIDSTLRLVPNLPEWLDEEFVRRQEWSSWQKCIQEAHSPNSKVDLSPLSPARCRLAYDELLANQLALAIMRRSTLRLKGRSINSNDKLRATVLEALPFNLTKSQRDVLREIDADMRGETRMLRLLQGDVGSGKTIVALLAMLSAVETGYQSVIMAPTELLARQHFATLSPLVDQTGASIELLTGKDKGKSRDRILKNIADGTTNIIVGTHALFQEDVAFGNLAFAVIDEQHKFGVHQRLALSQKGSMIDVLVMTATPIPRTLVLTVYGDMETSRLIEKPNDRKPIITRAMPTTRIKEICDAIKRSIINGSRVYWVCPLVKESEQLDIAAAEERYKYLQRIFNPDDIGLTHGRMKSDEKDNVMKSFKNGDINILVATTVIEVGVDVSEANIMVIEHAERFGLAQLHQLRGRIGRGNKESTCLLVYGEPLTKMAEKRIQIMRETEDGFRIAEEDLKIRGAGEILGTRQSGLPQFRIANLTFHSELLATARRDSQLIIENDAELKSDRGKLLRILLYLFERDEAVRNLRSG